MNRSVCLVAAAAAALFLASPAGARVRLVNLTTPVAAGDRATLTARVLPPAVRCSITVTYRSAPLHGDGLSPKRASVLGRVSWTWTFGRNTTSGLWPIVVSCGRAGTLRASIEVAGKPPATHSARPAVKPKPVAVGRSIALGPRTKTTGCRPGTTPDRRCSPGAYYTGLTKAVICSPNFRTASVQNVSQAIEYKVKAAYGLLPRNYAHAVEIDHIVPLVLGGSNVIANLFPEKLDAQPSPKAKDRLELTLHQLVCSGSMNLRGAQEQIAANWQALYRKVFGRAP
jgi:hypothetical protein